MSTFCGSVLRLSTLLPGARGQPFFIVALSGDLLSQIMRKSNLMANANNKCADQPAHTRSLISAFVIRYIDTIILILTKSEISGLQLVSVAEQAGLSLIWSQTRRQGFS